LAIQSGRVRHSAVLPRTEIMPLESCESGIERVAYAVARMHAHRLAAARKIPALTNL
jgi:hypothetical protein